MATRKDPIVGLGARLLFIGSTGPVFRGRGQGLVCLILSHFLFFRMDWSITEVHENIEMSLSSGTGILHV